MNKLVLALLLLAPSAMASQITCETTGPYPRMRVTWGEKTVTVNVENPRGFSALPQWEAPISLDMIPFMQAQSRELAGLGSEFSYEWDISQCKRDASDEWLVSCSGPSKQTWPEESNGVKSLLFTTAHIDEKSLTGKQSNLRLRFIFEKQSMFFLAIPFPMPFCSLSK